MKRFLLILLAMVTMIILAACGDEEEAEEASANGDSNGGEAPTEVPTELTVGAATQGGVWYVLGGAMSDKFDEIFPDSSTAIVEGGSTANILGIGDGTFDIGYTNGEAISEAYNGTGEFDEVIDNFSTIATLYPNPVQIVIREDSDIHSVEDLAGKTVSPGIRGYSGELSFLRILDILDMSYDDLEGIEYTGTEDAANLLRDNHIDAWIGNLAAPAATWQELDTTVGIRLISLDEDVINQLYEDNPGYVPYTIEAGTYPNQEEDAETVAPYTVMLVNNDTMPEEAVYELTKLVVENNDTWSSVVSVMSDFDAEYSVENHVGEMHPGAERYYKEVGAME
jgi:hypothetical protein